MIPPPAPSRVSRAAGPRGFAFLLLLSMLVVAAIVVATGLRRASAHALLVEKQLEGYRRHHEMLGIRDYIRTWIGRPKNDAAQLTQFAAAGEPVHRLVLDHTVVVLISVQDGQGTVLRNLADVSNAEMRRWLVELLGRLPRDRPDLTRRSGPPHISLRHAPDEVLDALAAYDPRTSEALREARDRGVANPTELQMLLTRAGVETMLAQAVMKYITFEPSLWRLNVEVVYPDRVNRYTLLAEKRANISSLHEWRPVPDSEAERLFGPGITPVPAAARPLGSPTNLRNP